ncbi:hypothetical protein B0T21DRAFT_369169 [Apiosordaria backusii]|uniref:Uncharacterized protein n=1 Tax=Apiosordaria backusii TaxID=314023 RepID=A0AA40BE06_9PEZI|nr:hypothetical protein B0T21DRAFT_369169 [Apiosordaria backusii]
MRLEACFLKLISDLSQWVSMMSCQLFLGLFYTVNHTWPITATMPTKQYTSVPKHESEARMDTHCAEHVLERPTLTSETPISYRSADFQVFRTFLAVLVILVTSSIFFILGRYSIGQEECGTRLSTWSPALQAVRYHQVTFPAAFTAQSVYRGTPTPELDAAWQKLVHLGAGSLRIHKAHLPLLNKSHKADSLLMFDDGTGDIQVMLEVFHQLHCLNELRKKTWPGYYPEVEEKHRLVDRVHTDHCIEILRIALMCFADVTPVTADLVDWRGGLPTPDFSTLHTCRDFDRIYDYVQDNAEAWVWA